MTYTFADLRKDVLQNVTVSSDFFGETVRYRATDLEGGERSIAVHCKHGQRFIFDAEGNEIVVEELTVTIDREALDRAPVAGDLVYRGEDTIGFLYAYSGGDQPHYWRRVFERRRRLSQG